MLVWSAMQPEFSAALAERIARGMAPIVVGLDPRPEALPQALAPGETPARRILAFHERVLPVLAPVAPAVKPNIGFFERFGAEGYLAYEATCALARSAGMLVIADIKRGDIGSTAEAYAAGHYACADAVTLHPYLGSDSIEPWLGYCRTQGKGAFVLVRTSNPGARELQDLPVGAGTLCETVARLVHKWGSGIGRPDAYSNVGAVVGATYPQELAKLRALMPRAWLLLPGVGAQGAKAEDVAAAFDRRGLGGLISQSRGILQCFAPDDAQWLTKIRTAAARFADEARLASRR